jgi:hypothetical protein
VTRLNTSFVLGYHGYDKAIGLRAVAIDLPALVQPFDSVRGLFEENPEVYPGSGFFKNTHSQIAIRNLDCIIEIFVPRKFHSTG